MRQPYALPVKSDIKKPCQHHIQWKNDSSRWSVAFNRKI